MRRPEDLISVTVADSKYTIQQTEPGKWEALRYGEAWPAFAGQGPDNLHVALAYEVAALRGRLDIGPHGEDAIDVAESAMGHLRHRIKTLEAVNSIIGCQTINWSEHIYPLVAALEGAGIAGMDYPAARANVGTLIERAVAAEEALAAMQVQA